jgi:hypothetical protein
VVMFAAGLALLKWIHPFLAITRPVSSKVLVVEGWVDVPTLKAAAEKFRAEGYEILLTTGGPTSTDPDSTHVSDTYASVAAKKLLELGVAAGQVRMVPCGKAEKGRTHASAAALREYLRKEEPAVTALNVLTEGTHARRTRLTYERVFGDEVDIGIISVADAEYSPEGWWRSSEGLKDVVSESAAYLYAKLLGSSGN